MGFPKKKAHGFSHVFPQKDHGFLSFCNQKIMGFLINGCSNECNESNGSGGLTQPTRKRWSMKSDQLKKLEKLLGVAEGYVRILTGDISISSSFNIITVKILMICISLRYVDIC